jgi:hypothetical protein
MFSRNITVMRNGRKTELCLDGNYVLYCEAGTKQENQNGQDVVFGLKCDRWGPQNNIITAYIWSGFQHYEAVQVNDGLSVFLGFVYNNLNVKLSNLNEYTVHEKYWTSAKSTYMSRIENYLSLVSQNNCTTIENTERMAYRIPVH